MKKKINIKEFAEMLGVSTATVSRAFNEKGRISDRTRQHILEKAEELGYRANIHARNLSSKQSNIISMFYPSIATIHPDYFITEIQLGIHQTLLPTGNLLQTHPIPPGIHDNTTMNTYRDYILSGGPAGIIIISGSVESVALVEMARSANIPYIVIGHMGAETQYTVTFDNAVGAAMAGKYFARTGRHHPAYIGGHLDKRKQKGFREGLGEAAAGLVIHPGGHSFGNGTTAFQELREQHPAIDCVLCANDVLAAGYMKEALTQGVRIPDDIAVIGFDDVRFARYMTPALSSVSLNLHQLGATAAQMLLKLLNGAEVRPELIQCELIIRESC